MWVRGSPTRGGVSSSRTTAVNGHRRTGPQALARSKSGSRRDPRGITRTFAAAPRPMLQAAERGARASEREPESTVWRLEPALRREARFVEEPQDLVPREPAGDLGADSLAGLELQSPAEAPEIHFEQAPRHEPHLDPLPLDHVWGVMLERLRIECAPRHRVHVAKDVAVEFRGHARRVVVGGVDDGGLGYQICAEQQQVSRGEMAAHALEQPDRLGVLVVADGAAQEERQPRAAAG